MNYNNLHERCSNKTILSNGAKHESLPLLESVRKRMLYHVKITIVIADTGHKPHSTYCPFSLKKPTSGDTLVAGCDPEGVIRLIARLVFRYGNRPFATQPRSHCEQIKTTKSIRLHYLG